MFQVRAIDAAGNPDPAGAGTVFTTPRTTGAPAPAPQPELVRSTPAAAAKALRKWLRNKANARSLRKRGRVDVPYVGATGGRVDITLKSGRTTIAGGHVFTRPDKARTVRVTVTKRGKKALRASKKRLKLSVTVSFRATGGVVSRAHLAALLAAR